MATTFLEPGGDADFGIGLWTQASADNSTHWPAASSAQVHGNHQRSILYSNASTTNSVMQQSAVFAQAGSRISFYLRVDTRPSATNTIMVVSLTAFGSTVVRIRLTSTGVLQLWENSVQIGSNGSTLSTATWYRLCLAYTITSTTVNQFRLFKNGVSDISVSNATITNIAAADLVIGNASGSTVTVMYTSDHYVDSSTALTDTGDVWVTAKRPFANGTTNGFTTQIGSGGSGYGSGHAPQVNERPLSTTNGWSMVGAGSAVTEEYSIENAATGDFNLTGATIVDFRGWIDAKSLAGETASLILAGSTSNVSLTSTITFFTKIAGSTTYPAGGTDIGLITTTALTTVSLYEAGIVVGFIPAVASTVKAGTLSLMGVG